MLSRLASIAILLALLGCTGGGTGTSGGGTAGGGAGAGQKPAAVAPAPAPAATGTGGLVGTVRFEGEPPEPKAHRMDADPKCCEIHGGTTVQGEAVLVDAAGGLANVLVWVKEGLGARRFPTPREPVALDQVGCVFKPHVFCVRTGQEIAVLNSDDTAHNVHAFPELNDGFNLGQPKKGQKTFRTFDVPEIGISVKCDVHPWMQSYAHVLDHPFYALTGVDGAFGIPDLPAGRYTIEAWHETFGATTQEVEVKAGAELRLDFTFRAR